MANKAEIIPPLKCGCGRVTQVKQWVRIKTCVCGKSYRLCRKPVYPYSIN